MICSKRGHSIWFLPFSRGIICGVLPYRPRVPQAGARGHRTSPDCVHRGAVLSGVNKISPLRGERFGCNFQKYGAVLKSHAALRFLPLGNCFVSSVKECELPEATRNGMQCCKFSRFSEKRPILGKNRAAAKAHFFWFVFFVQSQRKWTNITTGIIHC